MNYAFRFEYSFLIFIGIPLLFCLTFFRFFYHKPVRYAHSLVNYFSTTVLIIPYYREYFLLFLRFLIIGIIIFLAAKPQYVDQKSQIAVEGIDIMLVLDMSGSMEFPDFDAHNKTRFAVAKEEAMRFIEKRIHDAFGLVIFGKYALSRCPLTFDKKLLQAIVAALEIGFIDADGTMLMRAVVAGINRLKNSKAKSRILIVLTDGSPSEGDLDITVAIELAKQFSIKIYTIGIGSDTEEHFFHPLYGPIKKPAVNKEILTRMADQTGGQMFMAYNANEMRLVYETIDRLERSKSEMPIFYNQFDLYELPLLCVILLLLLERLLSATILFSL